MWQQFYRIFYTIFCLHTGTLLSLQLFIIKDSWKKKTRRPSLVIWSRYNSLFGFCHQLAPLCPQVFAQRWFLYQFKCLYSSHFCFERRSCGQSSFLRSDFLSWHWASLVISNLFSPLSVFPSTFVGNFWAPSEKEFIFMLLISLAVKDKWRIYLNSTLLALWHTDGGSADKHWRQRATTRNFSAVKALTFYSQIWPTPVSVAVPRKTT